MTKRILRRKIEEALCLESGCLDLLADRARVTALLQEHLDSIKNSTGQDTSRGSTRLRKKTSQGTMDGETEQSTLQQQQCSAINAAHRHPIMTCISRTHFVCYVCKWWHKNQKVCTHKHAPEFERMHTCMHICMARAHICVQELGNKGHGRVSLWQKKLGKCGNPFDSHIKQAAVHTPETVEAYLKSKDTLPARTDRAQQQGVGPLSSWLQSAAGAAPGAWKAGITAKRLNALSQHPAPQSILTAAEQKV